MNITVESLVRGQVNLDQMKRATEQTVRLCLHSVSENEFAEKASAYSGQIRWDGLNSYWVVEQFGGSYELRLVSNRAEVCTTVLGRKTWSGPTDVQNVQKMYEALPILLNGMLETFPALRARLEPYARASEVQL